MILPMLEEAEGAAPVRPLEPSPALAQILDAAEQRVSAQEALHPSEIPSSSEEDVDLLLPAEILSWLAEPLDADEVSTGGSASSASTGGAGYPQPLPDRRRHAGGHDRGAARSRRRDPRRPPERGPDRRRPRPHLGAAAHRRRRRQAPARSLAPGPRRRRPHPDRVAPGSRWGLRPQTPAQG